MIPETRAARAAGTDSAAARGEAPPLKPSAFWSVAVLGAAAIAASSAVSHGPAAAVATLALLLYAAAAYLGMHALLGDAMRAVAATVAAAAVISFAGSLSLPATAGMGIFALATAAFRRQAWKAAFRETAGFARSLSFADLAVWIVAALLAVAGAAMYRDGFGALDTTHPIYEISIGRSFAHSLWQTPDLSLAGKVIRFHPFSTQLPLWFSAAFGVPLLAAAYLATPLFLLFFLFIGLNHVAAREPRLRTPAAVIFFLPLIHMHLHVMDGFYTRATYSASFGLGAIFMLAAGWFLAERRWSWFFPVMAFLMLSKASFFVTAMGGAVFFLLRKRELKTLAMVTAGNIAIFVVIQLLFLSKAHQHNLWVVGGFPFWLIHNRHDLPIFALAAAGGVTALLLWWLRKEDPVPLAFASMCLSGALGMAMLTEISEGNAYQFWHAAFCFLPMLAWHLWAKEPPAWFPLPRRASIAGLLLLSAAGFSLYSYHRAFALANAWLDRLGAPTLQTRIAPFIRLVNKQQRPDIEADLIAGYGWLADHSDPGSRVLYGKHYEDVKERYTSYIRTAMSGRQMYLEGDKYKGVIMRPEYPERLANELAFYRAFVLSSPASQSELDAYFADSYGSRPPLPMSQAQEPRLKRYYAMSHKKEWSWINIRDSVDHEVRRRLSAPTPDSAWLGGFLSAAAIDYVVLENGDLPADPLAAVSETVYANPQVRILKIH